MFEYSVLYHNMSYGVVLSYDIVHSERPLPVLRLPLPQLPRAADVAANHNIFVQRYVCFEKCIIKLDVFAGICLILPS